MEANTADHRHMIDYTYEKTLQVHGIKLRGSNTTHYKYFNKERISVRAEALCKSGFKHTWLRTFHH